MKPHSPRTKIKGMWARALSVFAMTMTCLFGGDDAVARPMVKVRIKGSSSEESFLYDSGAQVSLINKKTFRKIKKDQRPRKLDLNLSCSGVSGSKLKLVGCYLIKLKILDQDIIHPFFVTNVPGHAGVIGIDLIKKSGLSLDAITNQPYFSKPAVTRATLTKSVYLPPRSKTCVKIKCSPNQSLQVLNVNIEGCPQVYCNEYLLEPKEEVASIWLTNVSQIPQKLHRGMPVGELEEVEEKDLHPWLVSDTTPLVPEDKIARLPAPKLDVIRKLKIEKAANLSHLPEILKDKYMSILLKNHECISLDEFDLGRCTRGAHSIPTRSNVPPTYQKQFPLPIEHEKEIRRQVLEWLKIGIIRPCESEFNSSLFLIAKKQLPPKPGEVGPRPKTYRIVQDLRALNKATLVSNVRLPEIHECLDRVAAKRPTVFSGLDLRSGYFQLPIEKNSQEKTAFTCLSLGQQFCFKVTSQGLSSAPASFARTMQRIFNKQIARNDLEVYLDDVLAYSKDHTEMLRTLDEALSNLTKSGMKINLDKCQFGVEKLTYLGFELNKDGFKPDPIKSEAITKVKPPSTLKGVRSFLGMANFYRLLIPRFSQLMRPLTKLTCKGAWLGGDLPKDAMDAFKKCQKLFTTRPFLHFPNFNLTFHLYVDASLGDLDEAKEGGLAACLVQYPNNDITKAPRPIGFCSRSLQTSEKNYSAHLVETLGIIFGIEFFEKYLRTKFVCHTDHKPLTTVKEGKVHRRTLERFREILANYDFTLEYTKGEDMPSDFLSRHVAVESVNVKSNLATSKSSRIFVESGTLKNETEQILRSCVAIQTKEAKQKKSESFTDQHKVEAQVHAIACNVENKNVAQQAQASTELKEVKEHTTFQQQVPPQTKESAQQQALNVTQQPQARAGVKKGEEHTTIQQQHEKSELKPAAKKFNYATNLLHKMAKFCICAVKGKFESFDLSNISRDTNLTLLKQQQDLDPFIQAMKVFVKDKHLPKERYRNIIKRWGPHCFDKQGITMIKYARTGYPTRELVVAPADRISDIIAEAHGSLLGGHDAVDKTAQRILQNYWFPGLFSETAFFIDNCSVCQKNKKKSGTSNTYLKSLPQATQVFSRVHLDLFGPMKTSEGKSYVVTMVDSFSKFAIFKEIPNKEATTVAKCFWESWLSIFGSPLSIVSDMGTDLNTKVMQGICDYLQIDKKITTPQHAQSNSQAEVLNKKLAKYLKSMVEKSPLEWPKLLSACQYAYNLSVHRALKNSPYCVLFGVEANSPLNSTGFVSQPIYGESHQDNMANRLKAARQLAKANNMDFRNDYIKRYNAKVDPHSFKEGQLVYLHRPEMIKINPKIQSEWFGPFVILSMVGEHNSLIQDLASRRTKFVNCNRLRAYNLTSEEWKSFKFKLTKDDNNEMGGHKDAQPAKQTTAIATAPTDYALFDRDSDIVVLTPHSRPMPKVLKVEDQSFNEIVSEQAADEQDDGGESTSLIKGMGNQLMKLVSPKKGAKQKKKGLQIANLPLETGGSLTRRTAKRANVTVKPVFGPGWNNT